MKPGVQPLAANNELVDYRYPVGVAKEYSIAPYQIGMRFSNASGNPNATFSEEGVLGLRASLQTGQEAELYAKCPSVGYSTRLGALLVNQRVFLAAGAAPLVEERLISNTDETLPQINAGYNFRYTHGADIPLWGNGYYAGVAAANEGLEPIGVVWKCKIDHDPTGAAFQSYVFENIVWKVFGE